MLRGDRLGAGLDDVELSVDPVLGPLHVHRPAVVLLDRTRVAGEFQNVLVGEAEASAVGLRGGDVSRRVLRLALDEDHLHRLVAEEAAQHRAVAGEIGRLVDVELVRVDGALNHVLAEAVGARHEDGVAKARLGVDGEHHTRRGDIGAHHLHHADRQRDLEVVEALVDSVVNGAIGEEAGEATAARVEQALLALDVEIRILLAGEARRRQVLRSCGAAHGETDLLAVLLLKGAVGTQNLGGQIVGQPRAVDDLSGAFGFSCQRGDIGGVEVVEFGVQTVPGAGLVQHVAIGLGGDGESVRHADALPGQLLEHLAQRGVLSADQRHVVDAEVLKEADVPRCTHDLSSRSVSSSGGPAGVVAPQSPYSSQMSTSHSGHVGRQGRRSFDGGQRRAARRSKRGPCALLLSLQRPRMPRTCRTVRTGSCGVPARRRSTWCQRPPVSAWPRRPTRRCRSHADGR